MIGAADIIQGIPCSPLTPPPLFGHKYSSKPHHQVRKGQNVGSQRVREGGALDVVREKREATAALNRNYIKTEKTREVKGHALHVKGEDGSF